MQFSLTKDEQELVALCHKVGTEALEPGAEDRDRNNIFPREPMMALAKAGINLLTIPKEYDGLGLGISSTHWPPRL